MGNLEATSSSFGRRPHTAVAALVAAVLAGCAAEPPRDLLLRDVQVVDLDTGELRPGHSVRIEDGSITAIGPAAELDGPAAEVIEGEGRRGRARCGSASTWCSSSATASCTGEEGFSTGSERLATALALYEMYAETYPDYHSAHYMLALARRATGDAAGARVSLERALEIHPEYVKARQQLAELDESAP